MIILFSIFPGKRSTVRTKVDEVLALCCAQFISRTTVPRSNENFTGPEDFPYVTQELSVEPQKVKVTWKTAR